ncbi:MAG: NAD(P)H-dependent oxidoreductase, partial [Acidimicrobiia bacterium]
MRIVGISGSSNPSSSNRAFLEALAAVSPEEFTIWSRLGELPHFSPELDGNDAVASLRSSVADADVVVIATPEYAGGMPGTLKNALDWLVGSGELYDRRVAVFSVAPSAERGERARQWVEQVIGFQGGR